MTEEPTIGDESPRKVPRPRGYAPLPEQPAVLEHAEKVEEDDSRTRAAKRAAELRGEGLTFEDSEDKFYINPEIIPEGWSYEWKRHTTFGKEDPAYQVSLRRTGWDPVPVYRHPELMPAKWNQSDAITRDGMVLMERPMEITIEARERDRKNARDAVRQKEQQLRGAPAGDRSPFEPNDRAFQIKKSYEPLIPSPDK